MPVLYGNMSEGGDSMELEEILEELGALWAALDGWILSGIPAPGLWNCDWRKGDSDAPQAGSIGILQQWFFYKGDDTMDMEEFLEQLAEVLAEIYVHEH